MSLRKHMIVAIALLAAACSTEGGGLDDNVEKARQDLANRLDVPIDEVRVVSLTERTWPDGSLGCPQPVQQYTQALVEGAQLVLEVNGTEYNYHAGGGRDFLFCPKLRARPGGIEPRSGEAPTSDN
jgi:hypothetical protein